MSIHIPRKIRLTTKQIKAIRIRDAQEVWNDAMINIPTGMSPQEYSAYNMMAYEKWEQMMKN
jgi:hypothetical protein